MGPILQVLEEIMFDQHLPVKTAQFTFLDVILVRREFSKGNFSRWKKKWKDNGMLRILYQNLWEGKSSDSCQLFTHFNALKKWFLPLLKVTKLLFVFLNFVCKKLFVKTGFSSTFHLLQCLKEVIFVNFLIPSKSLKEVIFVNILSTPDFVLLFFLSTFCSLQWHKEVIFVSFLSTFCSLQCLKEVKYVNFLLASMS